MPKDKHNMAAEHHEKAAKSHRTAAEHHGKGEHGAGHRHFEAPLGDPAPVVAPKYVCPRGDYTWYQKSAGSPKQRCPTHQIALVLAP